MSVMITFICLLGGIWLGLVVSAAVTGKPNKFFWNIHRQGLSSQIAMKLFYWGLPIFFILFTTWVGGLLMLVANFWARYLIKRHGWTDPKLAAQA